MSISNLYPTIAPSLSLDFANVGALDPRITFVRTTTATYYGTETAKAEENLLLRSQEFDTSLYWNKVATTITANTEVAPDGTTTAEKLEETAVTGVHVIRRTDIPVPISTTFAFSCFLKESDRTFARLTLTHPSVADHSTWFDLENGVVGTNAAGNTATIVAVGNDWYRCSIVRTTASNQTIMTVNIGTADADNSSSYAGVAGDGIFIWGAQLEQRSAVTNYTPTTTQPITNYIPVLEVAAAGEARFDHNPLTFESLGLLVEESRTNLALRSEEFDNAAWTKVQATITANTIVAPDGTLTGDKLIADATSNQHRVDISISATGGTTHTFSVYAKAGEYSFLSLRTGNNTYAAFDLSNGSTSVASASVTATMIAVGNGWYRCAATEVLTATGTMTSRINVTNSLSINNEQATFTGNAFDGIFIWGCQLEAGAFPTSYIQTVAATVTRNADAASMTGTNFTSWYRQDEGSLYAEAAYNALVTNAPLWNFNDMTTSNLISVQMTSSPASRFSVAVSGVGQANLNPGNLSAQTNFKLCGAYKTDDFSAVLNGGTAQLDTAGVIPVVTRTQIGGVGSAASNVRIKKLSFYPARLSNAQLQALTTV